MSYPLFTFRSKFIYFQKDKLVENLPPINVQQFSEISVPTVHSQ